VEAVDNCVQLKAKDVLFFALKKKTNFVLWNLKKEPGTGSGILSLPGKYEQMIFHSVQ